jgi:hypothetical protein
MREGEKISYESYCKVYPTVASTLLVCTGDGDEGRRRLRPNSPGIDTFLKWTVSQDGGLGEALEILE